MKRIILLVVLTAVAAVAASSASASLGLLETINITGPNAGEITFVGTIPADYNQLVIYWSAASSVNPAEALTCSANGEDTYWSVTAGSIAGVGSIPKLKFGSFDFPSTVPPYGNRVVEIECWAGTTPFDGDSFAVGSSFKLVNQ